jgi:hypothetical protein
MMFPGAYSGNNSHHLTIPFHKTACLNVKNKTHVPILIGIYFSDVPSLPALMSIYTRDHDGG